MQYKKFDVNKKSIEKVKEIILEAVKEVPSNSSFLQNVIIEKIGDSSKNAFLKELAKSVIKELWEEGLLCYVNNSVNWFEENRVYAHTASFYPFLNLNSYSAEIHKSF